jgi:signal transduction histidine kinase
LTVLSRLAKLSREVNQIQVRHDLSLRMPVTGKDELAQLGIAVNGMLAELEQSEAAERQQRLFAETLRRTAEKLAASIQTADTLRLIIEQLKQILPYDRALIVLVNEDEMLRVADTSVFAGSEQLTDRVFLESDVPPLADGLRSDRPILIPDVQPDSRPLAVPGYETFAGTWACVPLRTHATPIGLLCVARAQPAAYSDAQIGALASFAQQAALAVENAHILTQLETSLFELRKAQTQLARSARLSAAGEIAAGVAHQINNPLTAVIAEAHLLAQELPADDARRESVDAIRDAAERAGSVVQRMLDLTRVHDYVMQPVNVNESLQSSVSLVRAQLDSYRVCFAAKLAARLPLVSASRQHLEDVWLNLLLNARDAVSQSERGMIEVVSIYDAIDNMVRVQVRDNGPGIAPEHLKSVFEPFFTTKSYGTGLGLSICRDVIIRHGGQIEVQSTGGQGTTFTVSLPVGRGVVSKE